MERNTEKERPIQPLKTTNIQQPPSVLCDTTDALDHIHHFGYAHNDLKSNNVVLEKREDGERLHPVVIEVCCLSKAKNAQAKRSHLKDSCKDTYIAPELVDGSGKPSITSDFLD